jgi:3'-5' exoribonuclease
MPNMLERQLILTSHVYIRDMQPNQLVEGVYAVQNCQLGQTKNGKPFLKAVIADKSGRAPARMWSITEEQFNTLPSDGFVAIEGQAQLYQGEIQLILQKVLPCKPGLADMAELLPCTRENVDEMLAEVAQKLRSLGNEHLVRLAELYLADAALMDKFKRAPAAMSLHHAYIGGLLEHTRNLMRLADRVVPLYERLNPDIIKMGLFLHDLGKCSELTWETGFVYSTDGQLIGHIGRGVLWLQEKAVELKSKGTPLPEPILTVLHHIILSHHGQPEYGALKIPGTPEAWAVALLDNLDAKLQMSLDAARPHDPPTAQTGPFTEKVWALETRLYKPDPTTLDTL